MAVRDTIQIGHPALKAKNKKVSNFADPKIKQVIKDLRDTMRKNELIGIAGPQIAENYQIFVTEPRETKTRPKDQTDIFRVYINPTITVFSDDQVIIFEGCGSVLHGQLFGPVKRPKIVTIEAFNEKGKLFRLTSDGILARVIQHEYDHLHGIEFLEKISDYKQMMTVDYYIQTIKPNSEYQKLSQIHKIHHMYV